jgi:glycosyltransferase involved in cell wall biosynthesis
MRHSAVTFASQLRELPGESWDVLWVSDMLNLAEFLGLAPAGVRELPSVAYFHENQLTYPVRNPNERDLHFAFSNLTTAMASHQVWFNSSYHQTEFLTAARNYLSRMPDHAPMSELAEVNGKSSVLYPGISPMPLHSTRAAGPIRVLWNARWEHDKNPETFFAALRELRESGHEFRLLVLGESFRQSPSVFSDARREFAAEIQHWGHAPTREEYVRLCGSSDVVVSTADHEFFGLGVVEAVAAGAFPVLPDRLAYPEVIRTLGLSWANCFYDGTTRGLADRIIKLASQLLRPDWGATVSRMQQAGRTFEWTTRAQHMDDALTELCHA